MRGERTVTGPGWLRGGSTASAGLGALVLVWGSELVLARMASKAMRACTASVAFVSRRTGGRDSSGFPSPYVGKDREGGR